MFKRALDIIVHPFRLVYLVLLFPIRILYIILKDKKEKSNKSRKEFNPSVKDNFIGFNKTEFLEAGQLLFPEHKGGFEKFFNSFITDKKNFLSENGNLIKHYGNFDLENLKAIEIIYIFGDSKELLWMTDWRGEENKREVETFLETKLQRQIDWINVNKFREIAAEENQRDGNFIIDLLKIVDKDLEPLNKKMIFFNLGWDAYIYTVLDQTSFKTINKKFGTLFHGTEKLRK